MLRTVHACIFLVVEDMPSMQVQDLKGQQKFLESEIDNAQLKLVDYDSLKSLVSWHVNACIIIAGGHQECCCWYCPDFFCINYCNVNVTLVWQNTRYPHQTKVYGYCKTYS